MRSALCSEGPVKMQADAELAVARLPKDDAWRRPHCSFRAPQPSSSVTWIAATRFSSSAIEQAARIGSTETHAIAVGERSLIAAAPRRRPRSG